MGKTAPGKNILKTRDEKRPVPANIPSHINSPLVETMDKGHVTRGNFFLQLATMQVFCIDVTSVNLKSKEVHENKIFG